MNKKEIKEQLREICTAANSLAGALSSLTVRLSTDIMLDEEATRHCGQDASCPVGDGSAVDEKPHVPESLKELVCMQIVSVMPPGHKCQGCLFDRDYFRCEKKVELVGGYYLCLAPIPIVTE